MTVEHVLNVTRKTEQVIISRPQGQSRAPTSNVRDTLVGVGGRHGNRFMMRVLVSPYRPKAHIWKLFEILGPMKTLGTSTMLQEI